MTGTRRRSYEEGHRPKYLIVIDGSEECGRAIYFAAKRCARSASSKTLACGVCEAGSSARPANTAIEPGEKSGVRKCLSMLIPIDETVAAQHTVFIGDLP